MLAEESRLRQWVRVAWIPALLFGLAVIVRFGMAQAAGGLRDGYLNPDEGAYFGSSLALVNGLLPYQDFLLLHPPGIAVLLSPFALLSYVISEHDAFTVMRVGMLLLGGVNTVLTYRVARRVGPVAAVCAGLFYAVWFPAVRVESTSLLEGFVLTAILVSLLVTGRRSVTYRHLVIGGFIAGVFASVKVWSAVPLLVIAIAAIFTLGWRRALAFAASVLAGIVVICLPFFIAAPSEMFRMVVTDQLGRSGSTDFLERIRDILAVTRFDPDSGIISAVAFVVIVAIAVVAAWKVSQARLWVVLLVVQVFVLMITPNLFINYTAFTSVALALTIGAFCQVVANRVQELAPSARRRASTVLIAALILIVTPFVVFIDFRMTPRTYPVAGVSEAVAGGQCVTVDSALSYFMTDTFRSNVDNGCPIIVDFTGYVYETRDLPLRRKNNPEFQAYAIDYLMQGDRIVIIRAEEDGLTAPTLAVLNERPVLFQQDEYVVYGPAAAR